MTNQSKPDRQDGDGLRTFDTAGTILRRTVNVFTITCESPEIAERLASQLRATPSPARDAAEGAGNARDVLRSICKAGEGLGCSCADQNYQWFDQGCKDCIAKAYKKLLASVPPQQPAPDAVREALLDAQEGLRGLLAWTGATRNGVLDSEDRVAFEDDLKIALKSRDTVDRALSAPVPSPDRQISTLHKFVASQQDIDPEVRDQICGMIAGLSVAVPSPDWASGRDAGLAEAMFGIPPSPAVAAESDFETAALALGFRKREQDGKWWHPNQQHFVKCHDTAGEIFDWYFDKGWGEGAAEPETEQQFEDRLFKQEAADMLRLIDFIADKIGLPNDEELSRDNFNAWLATPPVRGDRETRDLDYVLNSLMLAVNDNQGNVPFVKARLRSAFMEILQPRQPPLTRSDGERR